MQLGKVMNCASVPQLHFITDEKAYAVCAPLIVDSNVPSLKTGRAHKSEQTESKLFRPPA